MSFVDAKKARRRLASEHTYAAKRLEKSIAARAPIEVIEGLAKSLVEVFNETIEAHGVLSLHAECPDSAEEIERWQQKRSAYHDARIASVSNYRFAVTRASESMQEGVVRVVADEAAASLTLGNQLSDEGETTDGSDVSDESSHAGEASGEASAAPTASANPIRAAREQLQTPVWFPPVDVRVRQQIESHPAANSVTAKAPPYTGAKPKGTQLFDKLTTSTVPPTQQQNVRVAPPTDANQVTLADIMSAIKSIGSRVDHIEMQRSPPAPPSHSTPTMSRAAAVTFAAEPSVAQHTLYREEVEVDPFPIELPSRFVNSPRTFAGTFAVPDTVELPRLTFPVFDGDIRRWQSFITTFDLMVHQREANDAVRLLKLRSMLSPQ